MLQDLSPTSNQIQEHSKLQASEPNLAYVKFASERKRKFIQHFTTYGQNNSVCSKKALANN